MDGEFTPRLVEEDRVDVPTLKIASNKNATVVVTLAAGQACPWLPSFLNAAEGIDVTVVAPMRTGCRAHGHSLLLRAPSLHPRSPCIAIVFYLLTIFGPSPTDSVLFVSGAPSRLHLAKIRLALASDHDFVPYSGWDTRRTCFPKDYNQTLVNVLAANHVRVPSCVTAPRTHEFKVSKNAALRAIHSGSALHQLYQRLIVERDPRLSAATCKSLLPLWSLLFRGRPPRFLGP